MFCHLDLGRDEEMILPHARSTSAFRDHEVRSTTAEQIPWDFCYGERKEGKKGGQEIQSDFQEPGEPLQRKNGRKFASWNGLGRWRWEFSILGRAIRNWESLGSQNLEWQVISRETRGINGDLVPCRPLKILDILEAEINGTSLMSWSRDAMWADWGFLVGLG